MSQYPPEKYPPEKATYSGPGSPGNGSASGSYPPPPPPPQHPGSGSDSGYASYPPPVPVPPPLDAHGKPVKPKKPSLIKRLAPGETPTQLLHPPPSSFERPPPQDLPYPPFPPLTLVGKTGLSSGFLVSLPEPSVPLHGPYPFATHDIAEEDWARFLHDVKIAASLAPKDRLRAALIPAPIAIFTGGVGAIIGILVTLRIEHRMKKRKVVPVGELIESWNRHFFNPRRLHVTLAKGNVTYSGRKDLPPPDMVLGVPTKIAPGDAHWRLVASAI